MSNHTGALPKQAQHTLNLNTFYTSWSVFLIRAETDPSQILLAISETYNFTIQDQEDQNSDRTEDRESVTPSSWMTLALCRKAHHDKLKTVLRRHPAERSNQEREWHCLGRPYKMRVS